MNCAICARKIRRNYRNIFFPLAPTVQALSTCVGAAAAAAAATKPPLMAPVTIRRVEYIARLPPVKTPHALQGKKKKNDTRELKKFSFLKSFFILKCLSPVVYFGVVRFLCRGFKFYIHESELLQLMSLHRINYFCPFWATIETLEQLSTIHLIFIWKFDFRRIKIQGFLTYANSNGQCIDPVV